MDKAKIYRQVTETNAMTYEQLLKTGIQINIVIAVATMFLPLLDSFV